MSDKLNDGYGGTLARKCQEQMKREGASELAAPAGSDATKAIAAYHLLEKARELLRPSHEEWRLHILGPDDIIPQPDELAALREANAVNILIAQERLKDPNSPNNPWCMAVVEKNGVEYSVAKHQNAALTAPAAKTKETL